MVVEGCGYVALLLFPLQGKQTGQYLDWVQHHSSLPLLHSSPSEKADVFLPPSQEVNAYVGTLTLEVL